MYNILQPHYDYGLRAVKSVLVMAGGLKRANPNTEEELVLIRALRDSNVPKFLADDLPVRFILNFISIKQEFNIK